MNETQFANKVRHALNQGLPELDAKQAERLRRARELALQRQRPEPALGLVWADNLLGSVGGWSGLSTRLVAPLLVLALGTAAVYTWQQNHRIAEVEELDALLLTDDLPIDAYLDRNFQSWLKKRLSEE